MTLKPFVKWLSDEITRHGGTRSLARKIGVSPGTVSNWTYGSAMPRPGNIDNLSRITHVSPDDIWAMLQGREPLALHHEHRDHAGRPLDPLQSFWLDAMTFFEGIHPAETREMQRDILFAVLKGAGFPVDEHWTEKLIRYRKELDRPPKDGALRLAE